MTQAANFLRTVRDYYHKHPRVLPWRAPVNSYHVLVSEFMLQQTQVLRVIPKYHEFLTVFPDIHTLAGAEQPQVLARWSGLGYNRRALYLYQAAKVLANKPEPWSYEDLIACKGIGPNTAAAILAYSYDEPVVFLETNIKTVLIHHFFEDKTGVSDKELLDKLAEVVPWNNRQEMSPRDFYWALMDYGTYLKATIGNQSHRSKSFTKQSKFEGSRRQIRGQVLRLLLGGELSLTEVKRAIPDPRLEDVLTVLEREQIVTLRGNTLMLYNEVSKL